MNKALSDLHLRLQDAATVAGCTPAEFLRRYAPKLKAFTVDGSNGDDEPCWLYGDLMDLLNQEGR